MARSKQTAKKSNPGKPFVSKRKHPRRKQFAPKRKEQESDPAPHYSSPEEEEDSDEEEYADPNAIRKYFGKDSCPSIELV
jgi:hypothetical protein